MSDAIDQVLAVTRRLGLERQDGEDMRVVIASQTYDAAVDDVWEAVTNPERLPRWFAPVTGEFRQGGTYQVEGNAGGTILSCERPHQLEVTWEFGGSVSWVRLSLTEEPDAAGTTLELRHTLPVNDHWRKFGAGATGIGWDLSLLGLRTHLSGAGPVDHAEMEAWSTSDEGREFMTRCSDGWLAAAIAGGEDEAAATAAAAACAAFYTGAEPPQDG